MDQPFSVIMPDGSDLTPRDCQEWAAVEAEAIEADGEASAEQIAKAFRLAETLARMAEKLAEAHRAELDGVLERVKRLEEEARVLNASILDRRGVAP